MALPRCSACEAVGRGSSEGCCDRTRQHRAALRCMRRNSKCTACRPLVGPPVGTIYRGRESRCIGLAHGQREEGHSKTAHHNPSLWSSPSSSPGLPVGTGNDSGGSIVRPSSVGAYTRRMACAGADRLNRGRTPQTPRALGRGSSVGYYGHQPQYYNDVSCKRMNPRRPTRSPQMGSPVGTS